MATYLILNLVFLLVVIGVLHGLSCLAWNKTVKFSLVVLLLTTAIFDSLLISLGIFAYNDNLILGMKIGNAPIEDFFYALLAVILVPSIWKMAKQKDSQ